MIWDSENPELLRQEFVILASAKNANISELCRRFNISRKTAYKWLKRIKNKKNPDFFDRSRRPKHIQSKVSKEMKESILMARTLYPFWGAYKLRHYMLQQGIAELKNEPIPATSTINKILKREGCINRDSSKHHKAFQRFEKSSPNELWQMDFKGYFSIIGGNCYPFTILDDHSRFAICLEACKDQLMTTVQPILIRVFSKYGLPKAMLMDNGGCWRSVQSSGKYSELTIWLIRLGIKVIHIRPYHPQTQGKDERFHRTLKTELLDSCSLTTFEQCQKQFDNWRYIYNHIRPHAAIGMLSPSSRYTAGTVRFPKKLPPIKYLKDDIVRLVDFNGCIHIEGKPFRVARYLRGLHVAIRPSHHRPHEAYVFFCQQKIRTITLKKPLKQGKNTVNVRGEF